MVNYRRRQLRFRAGNIGAAGGRPINPNSRTIKTVCAAQFGVSVATAGDTMGFEIGQANTPCTPVTNVTFSERGTLLNHPSEWPEIVAGGWKEARVLSSMYRFDVRFVGTDAAAKDFVFAYKFGISFAPPLVFTAGLVTIDNWKDMRQSRGWTWKRFSGTNSGGSVYPSQGRIEVKVPSSWKLHAVLHDQEVEMDDLLQTVSDAASNAVIRSALHICIFTIGGVALAADDILLDVTIFQKVKLTRSIQTTEMIDEADQVT